jgi:ribosomal protein S27AE
MGEDRMTTETEVPASLTAFGHPPRPARAVIVEQAPGQRVARTLAGLGMFWGLAVAAVFIPVAHFVLVPTFVVGGIVMAVKRAREDRRLLRVRGACPRCGAVREVRPGGRFVDGRSFDCPKCHGNLTLATHSGERDPAASRA